MQASFPTAKGLVDDLHLGEGARVGADLVGRETDFEIAGGDRGGAATGAQCAKQGQRVGAERDETFFPVQSHVNDRAVVLKDLFEKRHVRLFLAQESGESFGLVQRERLRRMSFPESREQLLKVARTALEHNEARG
jgi:hypothetical protein